MRLAENIFGKPRVLCIETHLRADTSIVWVSQGPVTSGHYGLRRPFITTPTLRQFTTPSIFCHNPIMFALLSRPGVPALYNAERRLPDTYIPINANSLPSIGLQNTSGALTQW